MKSLNFPKNIQYLVCSDFDETYFAHDLSNELDVLSLEQYINDNYEEKGILFGIVSASTQEMIQNCLEKGHFDTFPHFISTNSGTELWYIRNGEWIKDTEYEQRFTALGIDKSLILKIEDELNADGIELMTQEPFINAPFSRNYYYKSIDELTDEANIGKIRQKALEHHLIVNVSMCNPLIGDPEGHYDVDFFPENTGKDKIVLYLMDKFNIPHDNTYAFGDSGNDILMLNTVKKGYLVSNATHEAKSRHEHITQHPYNKGILSILESSIT